MSGRKVPRVILLLCVCLHLHFAHTIDFEGFDDGVISEQHQLMEGTDLQLICSLSQDTTPISSSADLYFDIKKQNYNTSHQYVQVVNDTTVTLNWPARLVQKKLDSTMIFCDLPGGIKLYKYHISIVSKPAKPKVECKLAEFEEAYYLDCYWGPGIHEQVAITGTLPTVITRWQWRNEEMTCETKWSRAGGSHEINVNCSNNSKIYNECSSQYEVNCPNNFESCCWLSPEDHQPIIGEIYTVTVTAKHALASVQTTISFNTSLIIEPGGVKQLKAVPDSASANLSWEAPRIPPGISLNYLIHMQSEWGDSTNKTVKKKKVPTATLR